MTTVLLGNTAPLMAEGAGDQSRIVPARGLVSGSSLGNTVTRVSLRDGVLDEDVVELALSTDNDKALNVISKVLKGASRKYAIAVLEINDAWNASHSDDPPEWVESDDKELAKALSVWFSGRSNASVDEGELLDEIALTPTLGPALRSFLRSRDHECPVGRSGDWSVGAEGVNYTLDDDPSRPPIAGGAIAWEHFDDVFTEDFRARWRDHELLTNSGRDALHNQHLNGTQPAPFNFMALANSATATSPNATDTTLTGEITTASGGLIRGSATHAHTGGTNTSTLTKTFTANGSDSLPVTVSQDALFNASSAGTMSYKTALNANATITVSGDNVAITHTITAG